MPKMKTHKGMMKRFRVTRKGKVLVKQRPGKGHLMSGKRPKHRRSLSRSTVLKGEIARKAARLMGGP